MRKNLIRYMAMMFIVGMLAAMMPGKVYALDGQEERICIRHCTYRWILG